MATSTIRIAVTSEDRERLEPLVRDFAGDDHSAFLSAALPVMESLARAERLRELQARNAERTTTATATATAGQDDDSLLAAIQRSYKSGHADADDESMNHVPAKTPTTRPAR
ncbi:MAG TPA: hypothetical protein VGX23_20440 [Actinocrinis sp.]|nr:hypothetical protein [Actinocrinis sp.]